MLYISEDTRVSSLQRLYTPILRILLRHGEADSADVSAGRPGSKVVAKSINTTLSHRFCAHAPAVLLSNDMPQAFEYFSKLPAELRLKIWDMSIVGRVITVKPSSHGLYTLDGRLPTPLLYVCQESRAQALFHYTPFLRYDTDENLGVAYISYTHDTVLLQRDNSGMTVELAIACLKPDLDKIESLVVDTEFIEPRRLRTRMHSTPEQLISLFRRELTGLREVFLLARSPSWYHTGHSEPVIALKDIRPFRKGPPDGYWPKCRFWHCDGEVDASSDTRRWIVYPNRVWKLDMKRMHQKKRFGPYGFDGLRRRILIERLAAMNQ